MNSGYFMATLDNLHKVESHATKPRSSSFLHRRAAKKTPQRDVDNLPWEAKKRRWMEIRAPAMNSGYFMADLDNSCKVGSHAVTVSRAHRGMAKERLLVAGSAAHMSDKVAAK